MLKAGEARKVRLIINKMFNLIILGDHRNDLQWHGPASARVRQWLHIFGRWRSHGRLDCGRANFLYIPLCLLSSILHSRNAKGGKQDYYISQICWLETLKLNDLFNLNRE